MDEFEFIDSMTELIDVFTLRITHGGQTSSEDYLSKEKAVEALFEFAAGERLEIGPGVKIPRSEFGNLWDHGGFIVGWWEIKS